MIANGIMPIVTTDGNWVVWLSGRVGGQNKLVRMRRNSDSAAVDSLALCADFELVKPGEPGERWHPVALDSTWIAVVGTDEAIWKCNVSTGALIRIGGAGLLPLFRVAGTPLLICNPRIVDADAMALDVTNGRAHAVKGLRTIVGYASHPTLPLTLVVVPGRPQLGRDGWRVQLRDWRAGRQYTVREDFHFSGSGVWLAK